MNEVRLEIEYVPSSQGSIDSCGVESGNNISLSAPLSTQSDGCNCFILGASKLGQGDQLHDLSQKYDGYISRKLSSDDGTTDVELEIIGSGIDNFSIYFDKKANQYATEIYVNGTLFSNNNNLFFWSGEPSTRHAVRLTKWSRAKYPIRITCLRTGIKVEYSNEFLSEVVRGSESIADNTTPTYSALPSYGSAKIIDIGKQLLKLAEFKLLKAGQKINMYFNGEQVGEYIAERWSYNYSSFNANVTLTDTISKWLEIDFDGIEMCENKTAYDLYLSLAKLSVGETFDLDEKTKTHLESISIRYMELNEGKLNDAWTKLCNLAQLNIFKLESGIIKVVKGWI